MDRRAMIVLLGGAATWAITPARARDRRRDFIVWKDPGCGCCGEWAKRIETAFGRKLQVVKTADMATIKDARGVPENLRSCHTAIIGGVVVEGHVPPADIKRLLAAKRAGVVGLAVPGMPAGSPGMDVGHDHRDRYQVFAFDAAGRRSVFATHG